MKKEISNEVTEYLSQGKSHQETFDLLKDKYYKQGKLLSDTLCKTPIPKRKNNLKALWFILLGILLLLSALRALNILVSANGFERFVNVFFLVILIYIFYSVAKYEKYTFQFLGVLGLFNTWWILRPVIWQGQTLNIDRLISLTLVVAMCICSYVLYYKLFVKHKVEKVPVNYMDGRRGFEIQAKFTER